MTKKYDVKGLSFASLECVADIIGLWEAIVFIWGLFKVTAYLLVHLFPLDGLWEDPFL